MMKIFLLYMSFFLISCHKCLHDDLEVSSSFQFVAAIDNGAKKFSSDRLLQEYEPIRILADYSNLVNISQENQYFIKQILILLCVSYLENALKVIQVDGRLTLSGSLCNKASIPSNYSRNNGTGGVDADLILFITAEDSINKTFLASGIACYGDLKTTRPVAGQLNFNAAYLDPNDTLRRQNQLSTTLHEITHILGFSKSLYQYYIDPKTLQRLGIGNVVGVANRTGVLVNTIILPQVLERAREYYQCPSLDGLDLENQGTSGTTGSHWERRAVFNEYMTADDVGTPVVSEFTLALLEGSGWYQVNYSMAEPLTWGKGQGCSFLESKCIINKEAVFPEFCSPLLSEGCEWGHRFKGFCGATTGSPISAYDYWENSTISFDPYSNNCPYYASYSQSDCEDSSLVSGPFAEEKFGQGSKCFQSTLANENYFLGPVQSATTYCFKQECVLLNETAGNYVLRIQIGNQTVECRDETEPKSVSGYFGVIYCPNATNFCLTQAPDYCIKQCWGKGTCMSNSTCQCQDGWSGDACQFLSPSLNNEEGNQTANCFLRVCNHQGILGGGDGMKLLLRLFINLLPILLI